MTCPAEIGDEEPIVRAVLTPMHVRGGALVQAAFRPRRKSNLLSVLRWRCRAIPDAKVKEQFKGIGVGGKNSYCGLVLIGARDVRRQGVEIEDAPDDYPGHAHFVYPFSLPDDEPSAGELFVRMATISAGLVASAKYFPDPDPDSLEWTIVNPELMGA